MLKLFGYSFGSAAERVKPDILFSSVIQGIKEGWYDGGSIAFAVILVIVVTDSFVFCILSSSLAVSDYRQSLQFQNLNEEKRNIQLEVSWFYCAVPADGVLITGHSLAIDESSMTGESKIVSISILSSLFNITVTAVGINTEWGLLMASISEDAGEETPLQVFFPKYFVRLNGVATFVGIVGLTVAAAVLVVLLARQEDSLFSVTIVVVAVPEGLPLAVTLT
ncbi:hypothetical protein BHE74_00043677 [Ensete ventricosum]|nr:hypothetical protein BHE74_00043677 [Ensete ventricosum]